MIKGAARSNGEPMLIIGLTGENMARLMNDEPILFDAAELGLPALRVLILGGRTEETIAADLRNHIPHMPEPRYQ